MKRPDTNNKHLQSRAVVTSTTDGWLKLNLYLPSGNKAENAQAETLQDKKTSARFPLRTRTQKIISVLKRRKRGPLK